MPIKALCSNCDAAYNLAETMLGKQVKCKHCGEVFRVRDANEEDQVQPSARPSRGAARRDYDDGDDRPRRRRPDDDDRPRRRSREESGSKTGLIIALVAGGLVLVGGGVTAAILLSGSKEKTPEEQFAEAMEEGFKNMDVEMPKDFAKDLANFKDEMMRDAFKDKFANPFADRPAFKDFGKDVSKEPKGFPDFGKPAKQLTLGEHLQNLKTGDEGRKSEAVRFFIKADPNVPERAEVAKALDALAQATRGRGDVARALGLWATKDQAPTLIGYVQDTNLGTGDRRQNAMEALGKLKDERGVEAIANRLGDAFDWPHARKALESYGATAQAGLARVRFHKNDNIRKHVKELLEKTNTPPGIILPQAIKDLATPDREVRVAAATWLAECPVEVNVRPSVAQALDPLLSVPDVRGAAIKALEVWATADNVPTLANLLKENVQRVGILKILGRLKDARAADAIAARLVDNGDRPYAVAALKEIGPATEKAVLPYVNYPNQQVSGAARKHLQELGKNDVILTQTLKDIGSPMDGVRRTALDSLATGPVEDRRRGDVMRAIEPLLADGKNQGAYKVFFHWAGPESLKILITMVVSEPSPHRGQAMDALAKLKDENGAAAIATRLAHGDHGHASKLLKGMGAIAERGTLQMLGHKEAGARIEACHVLAVIGTRASITYLQQAVRLHPKDKRLASAAASAAKAIQSR